MKGQKTGGRKKGSKNKINTDVRMASLRAMHYLGEDGQGKGGLDGYMLDYARSNRAQFQKSVIPRLIPTKIEGGDPNAPVQLDLVNRIELVALE